MQSLDKLHLKICDFLKTRKNGMTEDEIAARLGVKKGEVSSRLKLIKKNGDVTIKPTKQGETYSWVKKALPPQERVKIQKIDVEHLKKTASNKNQKPALKSIDMGKIQKDLRQQVKEGKIMAHEAEILEQRSQIASAVSKDQPPSKHLSGEYIKTGIEGFDKLFDKGIPLGSTVLVAGGTGSGKTIFTLQTLMNHVVNGEKGLYMSFEESEERLIQHLEDFGFNPREYIEKGNLIVQRFNPFDITRSVDALLMKAKGELKIEVEPILFPDDFKPNIIAVDSLTAIASAFGGKHDSYRIYIEQLFRLFEKMDVTSFLITESKDVPRLFSQTGVEEFLADGIIVLYKFKSGESREKAVEIFKMRGENHDNKTVSLKITSKGVVVDPNKVILKGDIN